MTKRKSTKSALFSSVIALFLCFTMLLGTTFAWFTDSVTSANNIIKSGNLDIILEYYDTEDKEWKDVDGSDEILDKDALWEPGYTDVAYLRIKNNGSLALKYQLGVNIISETEGKNKANETFKLSDYIYYDVVPGQQDIFADRNEAMTHATETTKIVEGYTTGDSLPAGSDYVYMAMVVYMPTSVGNEANHNGVDIPEINLGINVFATQDTVESDSFNNQYDVNTAVFTVADANARLAENKDVTLVNCIEPNGILYVPKGYTGTLTLHNVSIASIQEGDAPATAALSEDTATEIEATDIVILGNVVVRATADGMSAITGTALNISGNGNLVAVANGKHAFGIGGTTTEYINIENVHIVDVKGGCVQPLFVSDLNYGKSEPEGGAAIGSGFKGAEINLTNVTVDNAQGGSKAAGIGAMFHTGVTINITDSIIKNVEGGNASAGIGGSRVSDDVAPADQHVIINIKNSTVNATGGQFGAGIGSGYDTHCGEKNDAAFITETICTINIDATSDITAQGGKYAAGVGTGYHVAGLAGNIECEVNATAGESREKYTIAQNVGFGVVDHSREVKHLTTAPTLTYMGKVINVPEVAISVANLEDFKEALATGGDIRITAPFTVDGVLDVSADTYLYNSDPANIITFAQNARLKTAENADLALYGVRIDGAGSYTLTEDAFNRDQTKNINNDAILMAFGGSTLTLGKGTVIENVVSQYPAVAWAKGTVDNRATIILDGATIRNCAGGSGTIINVDRYGDVYIEEGTVIENNVSSSGNHGIIRIYNDNWDAANASTLTMNGGEIRDNYFSGNGMIGLYYAKMYMNGGKISNNSWLKATASGNGFYCVTYVHSNAQFIMNGGEISGNTITDGVINAINSEVEGAVTFNGGTVTNNANTRNENKDALVAVCYPGAVAFSDGTGKVLVISENADVTGTIYSHANLQDQVDKKYVELSEFLGN